MKQRRQLPFLSLSILLFLALSLIYSCSPDDVKTTPGNASVDFLLTDAPCGYDEVNIDVQGLEIHSDVDGWQTITPFNAGIYNLLDLSNGLDTFLCQADLPAGKISQIRLLLGDDNTITVDGTNYDLKVPSGSTSGLKLNLHMELLANTSYSVWLDFDACKSVVAKGNGTYSLKPVIRAYSDSANGKLKGIVMPLNAGSTVYAIQNSDSFAAIPNADGFFMICGLDGTYDVYVDPADTSSLNDTLISSVNIPFGAIVDMDTIQLQ